MKKRLFIVALCLGIFMLCLTNIYAQTTANHEDHLQIDVKGIMRWKKSGTEAAFFGVNYTVPFAYGYRSHKALGIDPQTAIDNDVYHMARLGVNAFRVHVWDAEISDVKGNLLNNEHLRLFDYLLAKLEERGIYILITPIAFWGNGYPEKDEQTGSFSNVYGKEQSVVNEKAIQAQERYLAQFYKHVNPYTKKTYGKDPFVVATEINNEPKHSGPKLLTTTYINRLKQAIKSTGWTKPVFYNISESPKYADAVAASKADGFSFQWYPTGLVAGHEQKGNFLPNVDRYTIPFDTIKAFHHKPKIIYEFDAADILQSYMYPAMARSFRTAGFQWATQFAYDPLATAYANTEYQTHYLNLAYTPSKAISLLIAGEVFRNTPLNKSFGSYPADTLFTDFSLSYAANLSEMNSTTAFYYSNTTHSRPRSPSTLKHIAGVGSSAIASYQGNGAYFLDLLPDGNWRLEVMPDVAKISDPFATASVDKAVNKIVWNEHPLRLDLPGLQADFLITGLNKGNAFQQRASGNTIQLKPGTYLVSNQQTAINALPSKTGVIGLTEFVAPQPLKLQHPLRPESGNHAPIPFTAGKTISILDPAKPRDELNNFYLEEWANNSYAFTPAANGMPAQLQLKHTVQNTRRNGGLEIYIKDLLQQQGDLAAYRSLVINASAGHILNLNFNLISGAAISYGTNIKLSAKTQTLRIALADLKAGPLLLLPRPYPGFEPLYFQSTQAGTFKLSDIEKFQLSYQLPEGTAETITINSIHLEK
jgi:hypothetical protein